MRSGTVNLYADFLGRTGINGYRWSSTATLFTDVRSASAYYLDFDASDVGSSAGPYPRWSGYPVRCLASGV